MAKILRIGLPVGAACLAILVFCLFGMKSEPEPAPAPEQKDAAVTYSADSWSTDGLAGPAVAQETAAAVSPADPVDRDKVPPQKHRDSGYKLTDDERIMIERIVMCEAGGEGERGQMMVAQCILEGMLRYHYTIDEYIINYKVELTGYSNVTDEVRNSVSRVFDNGERVIEEKADLWYNPAITPSQWHEEQQYVITIGSHRFFWMQDNNEA